MMLEGRSIICFAHDWDGDPTSKTHIMRILAAKNRILWVNSIAMRRPAVSRRDLGRLATKLRRGLQGCVRVHDNLHVFSPLVFPFPGMAGVDDLNRRILTLSIRRLARRLRMVRPLLWTFLPNVNGLVGHLGENMVIYHCVDEYAAFSGVRREALERMERDLLGRAHLVVTSSERLCHDRRRHNQHTYYVSHGVDADHFARALDPGTAVPADVGSLPSPRVGFFGLIADWVDLDLIRRLALARPQWSFVLVGKVVTELRAITGLPNVRLLGQKPYEVLPGYCRAFDVGIVPFRINELTLKANPLKLREYFAAGLPVVATDLPEIRRYRGLARLASGAESFLREIEAALGERGPEPARRRVEAMKAESWQARVEEISALILDAEQSRRLVS